MSAPIARLDEPALLSAAEFSQIAEIAKREAGLALSIAKKSMISARIARRLRDTGQPDFAAYVAHLQTRAGADEMRMLISALTTNVSHFFREEHHFRMLADDILPHLVAEARAGRRVRIWSAGCANGQEPYSIAMTILRQFPDAGKLDLRILATDIDETALARAAAGRYPERHLDGVAPADLRRFFRPAGGEDHEAGHDLRAIISFRPLNLMATWPFRGPFDVVFCRNVVIYFDAATQAALWPRFHAVLAPRGVLFIGHSERIDPEAGRMFESVGVTSYRKRDGARWQEGDVRSWH